VDDQTAAGFPFWAIRGLVGGRGSTCRWRFTRRDESRRASRVRSALQHGPIPGRTSPRCRSNASFPLGETVALSAGERWSIPRGTQAEEGRQSAWPGQRNRAGCRCSWGSLSSWVSSPGICCRRATRQRWPAPALGRSPRRRAASPPRRRSRHPQHRRRRPRQLRPHLQLPLLPQRPQRDNRRRPPHPRRRLWPRPPLQHLLSHLQLPQRQLRRRLPPHRLPRPRLNPRPA